MSPKQRRAYTLKKRADAARVQQLRGVFAACDEDVDGFLSLRELKNSLLAIGVDPVAETLARFSNSADDPADVMVDMNTFLVTAMAKLDAVPLTDTSILHLFHAFDKDQTGRVPLATLLHVLCEVETPSSLSIDEVNELLRMTGMLSDMQLRDPKAIYALEVDYKQLCRHLTFPLPRRPPVPSTVRQSTVS